MGADHQGRHGVADHSEKGGAVSLSMTKLVWKHFNEGGNVKLALLCLADYANPDGVSWPSMSTIALRLACSESQARRAVHRLLGLGVVVTGCVNPRNTGGVG